MKPLPEPIDPLLQSLVDETGELPRTAAAHARSRRSRDQAVVLVALVVAVMVLAAETWSFRHSRSDRGPERLVMSGQGSPVARPPVRRAYVKVYQPGESAQAETVADASEREKQVLKQLSDVPVLIVRNKDGQVDRIHIFER